jgi:hypothetical protein
MHLLGVLLYSSLLGPTAWAADLALTPAVQAEIRTQAPQSVRERSRYWIERLRSAPYELGPVGEGEDSEFDARPLFRSDKFDCHTWVDTIVALSLSKDTDAFKNTWMRLRYEGQKPGFYERRHFMEISNVIPDITRKLYPDATSKVTANVNLLGWVGSLSPTRIYPWNGRARSDILARLIKLQQLGATRYSSRPVVQSSIDFIPFSTLPKLDFKKLPAVSVIEFVRENWKPTQEAGTQMWIAHRAILLNDGATPRMLHSSKDAGGVVSVSMLSYAAKRNKNWAPGGVRFLSYERGLLE